MQTISASTPVSGPSSPRARNVRPPAVSVRRVREGENSSNIMSRPPDQRSFKRPRAPASNGQMIAPTTGANHRLKLVTGLPVAPSIQNKMNW